jgi:hypothetical protein
MQSHCVLGLLMFSFISLPSMQLKIKSQAPFLKNIKSSLHCLVLLRNYALLTMAAYSLLDSTNICDDLPKRNCHPIHIRMLAGFIATGAVFSAFHEFPSLFQRDNTQHT